MIPRRLLLPAVLLAAAACTSTPSPAPEPVSPETAAVPATTTAQQEEPGVAPAIPAPVAPPPSLDVLVDEVRDRVDGAVSVSRRALEATRAAHDSTRDHAANVFARITQLRKVLGDAGISGSALDELDKLEQQARTLDESSAKLLDDLGAAQTELEALADRVEEVVERVAALEVEATAALEEGADAAAATDEVLTVATALLRDLESDADGFVASGVVEALEQRSDDLVGAVTLLVGTLDRVETGLQAQLATVSSARASAEQATDAATAAAKTVDAGTALAAPSDATPSRDVPRGEIAEVRTNKGTLLLQFFPDVAPNHVENFKRLVRDGFYDGLTFHRVIPGYIVQGGCPRGDGLGGPGWTLDAEFNDRRHRRGTLSMARFAHPDSAGSQFFVCLDDRPELDRKQTVFGRVIRGEATLSALEAAGAPDGVPTEPLVIERILLRPWVEGDNEPSLIAGNPLR